MLRDQIIKAVKAKLDEFSPFEEPQELVAIATSEIKPVDSYIESVLAEAADAALTLAPLYLIQRVSDLTAQANGNGPFGIIPALTRMQNDEQVGVMPVPHDFLRIHTVKFDLWRKGVNTIIQAGTPEYYIQRNPYTRGKTEKPAVAINNGNFEIYSLPFDKNDGVDHCESFCYISRTDSNETVFEDSVAGLIILEAAKKVLGIFGESTGVKMITTEEEQWLSSRR